MMELMSPTLRVSISRPRTMADTTRIAASEAGITLVSLGSPQMMIMVSRTRAEHDVQLRPYHPVEFTISTADLEGRELGEKDNNRQAVHKTKHHRVGHQSNKLAELEKARSHLDKAGKNNGGEDVFDPVTLCQADNDHSNSPGGTGNHAWAPTKYSGNQANAEGGIESGKW